MADGCETMGLWCCPLHPPSFTDLCLPLICTGFGPPSCRFGFGKVCSLFTLGQLCVTLFVHWAAPLGNGLVTSGGFHVATLGLSVQTMFFLSDIIWCVEN